MTKFIDNTKKNNSKKTVFEKALSFDFIVDDAIADVADYEKVEFIGTMKDVDYILKSSDMLLLSCPLNDETNGLINRQKLELMKDDAILINVARGPIIAEKDLYEHLKSHPNFYAGIDAWWIEPFKYGKFKLNYPFFELPNILGSPHNSSMVKDAMIIGTEKALDKVKQFINKENIQGLIN